MKQDFIVVIALLTHNSCSNLTETYTMSPSGSSELEPCRYAIGISFSFIHDKG